MNVRPGFRQLLTSRFLAAQEFVANLCSLGAHQLKSLPCRSILLSLSRRHSSTLKPHRISADVSDWGYRTVDRRYALMIMAALLVSIPISAEKSNHLYLCRSPLLAFDFWGALLNLQRQGEMCDGMKAGRDPQCIRVEAVEFKPIASGWGGAMAMTDGKTRMWFHDPDAGGWIHPDYYVSYVNSR
jgi:hypothetical protein